MTAPRAALTPSPALGEDIAASAADPLDIDPFFESAPGPLAAAQAVLAALHLENGTLWWAADRGVDVRSFLHGSARPEDLELIVESECLKDERVESADVTVTVLGKDAQIKILLAFRTDPATVSLTLTISEVNEAITVSGGTNAS